VKYKFSKMQEIEFDQSDKSQTNQYIWWNFSLNMIVRNN
jgi:hypothetical protein